MNLFLRSLIFFLFSCITIPLYSIACIISLLLPLRYRFILIRSYLYSAIVLLRVVCHLDYRLEGIEHLPKDRAGIILSKHQSTWETFFLPLIFHDPAIIVKRELLWVPFFGWGLAVSDPIVINRKKKSGAMQQLMQKGKKCLESGRWVLIFPEGTRIPAGEVGHYRLGGARLAASTGYPVIPVAHNAGRFWPKRKFIKQPGTISIVIGPLIESKGKTPEEIMAKTKNWIENTMLQIDQRDLLD
ncbi:MAG: hypothetical protein A3F12_07340 [Gammaproteobacteria bacterium RIFCSPHIGHO2_12_FULL_38_14]|nr:MAG: hypothetical protein A3F12_07340 [Gammaproteobacteria bacterium RIFCSPHIGHO2_12_FULL_38_14]